jgi:hypothetical protein
MSEFKRAVFTIVDGPAFVGITNSRTWDGWQMPWFALSEMKAIQDWIEDGINTNDMVIEGDKISVFCHSSGERPECQTMEHEGITHYHIDGWCWDKA